MGTLILACAITYNTNKIKLKAVDLLMTNVDVAQIIVCPRDTSKNREAQRMRLENSRQKCHLASSCYFKRMPCISLKQGNVFLN